MADLNQQPNIEKIENLAEEPPEISPEKVESTVESTEIEKPQVETIKIKIEGQLKDRMPEKTVESENDLEKKEKFIEKCVTAVINGKKDPNEYIKLFQDENRPDLLDAFNAALIGKRHQ